MPERMETESRKLLRHLRDTLAERGQGQERLDRITHLISDCIGTEVCFNCLFRDPETPQLCATGGLVGRVARTA
jgi:phosphotransferase system enzyme I (PtsP)